jgi:hypothetical protein
MALGTEAAAVNTAVDTLLAAWDNYLDGLTAGTDHVLIIPIAQTITPADTHPRAYNSAVMFPSNPATYTTKVSIPLRVAGASNNNLRYILNFDAISSLGYWPLFFKVTNDAGDKT